MAGATAVFAALIGFRFYGLDGACWAAGVTCVVMLFGSEAWERLTSIRQTQADERLYNMERLHQSIARKMVDLEDLMKRRGGHG